MEKNITEISSFLEEYKNFTKQIEAEKFVHFKAHFDELLCGYRAVKEVIKTLERKEAGNYNIFNILNISTAETSTHTPFLRNLLDVNASHGQGDLFLKSFIREFIPSEKRKCFELDDFRDYRISEEKWVGDGRIDLYISSNNIQKKFGIVIENKVYAVDQYKQLERYHNYLKKTKCFKKEQRMIFYLTVNGIDPNTVTNKGSVEKRKLDNWKAEQTYKNLSYKRCITEWLQNVINEVQASRVNELIGQYLATIETL